MSRKTNLDPDSALSSIPLTLLTYIARSEDDLGRFMALTGISPKDLKARLSDPLLHAAILDFAMQNESLLLAFAAQENLPPDTFMRVRSKLPGFSP